MQKGTAEQLDVTRMLLAARKQAAKEDFESNFNGIREKYDAAVTGSQERIALANQELALVASTYGVDSQKYIEAEKVKTQAVKEHNAAVVAAQMDTIEAAETAALAQVKIEQAHYKTLAQMGQISAEQLVAIEAQLDLDIISLKTEANRKEQALDNLTIEQKRKLAKDLVKITKDADVQIAQDTDAKLLAAQQKWRGYFNTITQGFATTLQGMLAGTTTFKQGMLQIGSQLLSQFLTQRATELANYLSTEAAKTGATVAGAATRTGATVASNTVTQASDGETAIGSIFASAASVFGKVYDSIAGIPFVGPFLAPAMAIAAMAAVAGMVGKVASAEGGWGDVPADGMLTELHKQEMVLPADIAGPLRQMVKSGGGQAAQVHIHAMDARSFVQFARRNPSGFAAGLKTYLGNNPGLIG